MFTHTVLLCPHGDRISSVRNVPLEDAMDGRAAIRMCAECDHALYSEHGTIRVQDWNTGVEYSATIKGTEGVSLG